MAFDFIRQILKGKQPKEGFGTSSSTTPVKRVTENAKDVSAQQTEPILNIEVSSSMEDSGVSGDTMSRDLMVLIAQAIETWAKKYGLNNMPKDIVFDQALSIMNSMSKSFFHHD